MSHRSLKPFIGFLVQLEKTKTFYHGYKARYELTWAYFIVHSTFFPLKHPRIEQPQGLCTNVFLFERLPFTQV